jgi:hypothetical protein
VRSRKRRYFFSSFLQYRDLVTQVVLNLFSRTEPVVHSRNYQAQLMALLVH